MSEQIRKNPSPLPMSGMMRVGSSTTSYVIEQIANLEGEAAAATKLIGHLYERIASLEAESARAKELLQAWIDTVENEPEEATIKFLEERKL